MRAVLGSLFRDACNRPAVSNGGNSPDRLSGEMGGQVSAVPITSDLSSDFQKAQLLGFNQKKVNFFSMYLQMQFLLNICNKTPKMK